MTAQQLEPRLRRLEAREAICELVARYCFFIDNHDVDGIGSLFTSDVHFRSKDGVMDTAGRDAIVQQFHGRFAVLGPSNHFTHDHPIWFDGDNDLRARVLVEAHTWAEGLAQRAPLALARTKQAMREATQADYSLTIGNEATLQKLCIDSADSREGIAAFLEKRKAEFKGN